MLVLGLALRAAAEGAPPDLDGAWSALRAGQVAEAKAAFGAALATVPGHAEALTGLGYAALREGALADAASRFSAALARDPDFRDALVGMAMIDAKRNDVASARARVQRVLTNDPDDGEARALWDRYSDQLQAADPILEEAHPAPKARPAVLDLPMRVNGRTFELRHADGTYRPIFLKGIDLGAALPGRFPSEFPTDPPLYRRWFRQMKDTGFHAVRIYTILPPAFYDTLAEFNRSRPHDPLYLIHGVWVELPEDDHFDDPAFVESYREEIRRVVDLAHGALDLPKRPGHAGGRYRTDVSRWWIATIMGREWEPYSVLTFDAANPGTTDFAGRFVTAKGVTHSERWQAQQLDYMIAYEADRWNAQRPTAWTNWPTLDPLHHPTETPAREERVWQRKLGLFERKETTRDYDDDAATFDMEKFAATPANQGGLFASYHVYPYYPDFMANDPGYRRAKDPRGNPNAFYGYLKELLAHHKSHPVFIAEYGIPTSRDVAHVHPQGWTHGNVTEVEQGRINAEMLRTIHEVGASGGALFAWIDEWFKHTWLTRPVHLPAERNPLWHDRQCPEQNFGLIAYRAGRPGRRVVVDALAKDWDQTPPLLQRGPEEEGEVRALHARADETDLHLLLRVRQRTPAAFAVAIDTVDPERGEKALPARLGVRSAVGFEAALLFDGTRAQVVVAKSYDRFTHRMGLTPVRPADDGPGEYVVPHIMSNRTRVARDGTVIPEVVFPIGTLRRGTTDRQHPKFDDLAEWQYDADTGIAEFRIPWGLINVTDPSSRSVLFEGPDSPEGHKRTDGLRFAVAAFVAEPGGDVVQAKEGAAVETLPARGADGRLASLPLFTWETWDLPTFHSQPKRSLDIYREALRSVPETPWVGGPDVAATTR